MSDSIFYTLSERTQQRIDQAFNQYITPAADETSSAGGFIIEHSPDLTPIPLALIPNALECLGLPSDDDQVLSVFRNAASGWSSDSLTDNTLGNKPESTLSVSREDWRSVCAVLLEDYYMESNPSSSPHNSGADNDESDDYKEGSPDVSQDDSDEEFKPEGTYSQTRRRRGAIKTTTGSPGYSPKPTSKLTASQRRACLETFALFFPDVPSSDVPNQRLMIKDIQRVASLLKEKIKAPEIIEMLEMFSTSPDKSMNFSDFTRMLDMANLL